MPAIVNKKVATPLHIEWSPGWVRVVDVATVESAEGASLSEVSGITARSREAIVGVSRNSVFLKAIRLPRAGREDLRRIIGIQLDQIFPLPADQLVYEFIQTADNNSEGNLTLVAGMRSEELKSIRSDMQRAGLAITRILPIALAAPAVALSTGVSDALVLELTPRGLTIDVVQGGILRFSRVAAAQSDPVIEVQRTLSAVRAENLPVVASGDIRLEGAVPSLGNALSRLHEAPAFAFELPEERGLEAKRRYTKRLSESLVVFMLAVLFAIGIYTWYQGQISTVQASKASWTRQLKKLNGALDTATTDETNVAAVQDQLTNAFRPAQPLSDLVSVVGDSLPPDAWITQLNLQRGKQMQIRGVAKSSGDVSTLVTALGKNSRFRDVKLVFANTSTVGTTSVVEFNVNATCVGNLPLPAPDTSAPTSNNTKSVQTADAGSTGTN